MRKNSLLLLFVGLAMLLGLFLDPIGNLLGAWQTEEYSHGFLIPLIALFLAWHRVVEVKPPLRPSWGGVALLVMAGGLLGVGSLAAFVAIQQYALLIALAGLVLVFAGKKALWVITPAFFYLVFAIPLPKLVQAELSQELQLLSSSLGVLPLTWLGISVFQEGNVIDLGGYRLQVVDACSGLRYLFPLMSFGYLVAFLLKDKLWKRVVLFLSTIPIAVGMNALRIAIIGVLVNHWGTQMAEGFIHALEGWTVFALCTLVLFAELWLLQKIGKEKGHFAHEYMTLPKGPLFADSQTYDHKPAAGGLLVLLLGAGLSLSGVLDRGPDRVPPHLSMAGFPLTIEEWKGKVERLEADVLESLRLSDYWLASYAKQGEVAPVNLYVAYYDSQRIGVMTHTPANCLPGGGWHVEEKGTEELHLEGFAPFKVSRLIARQGDEGILVYYWFDERGRNLTETYGVKWYLLLDALAMKRRSDGALIRLVTPLGRHEDVAQADERVKAFIQASYPKIKVFLPAATER